MPPRADKRPHVHTEHGVERPDPYHWMRDRDDPALIPYIEAENAWAEEVLAPVKAFRTTLFDEMLARIEEDDETVPYQRGDWFYYSRTESGKAYPIYCRKASLDGDEEVILDVNALAEGHEYLSLGVLSVSPDGRTLAYATDTTGREIFQLVFKDLASGEALDDQVDAVSYGGAWDAAGATFFYTRMDDALRPFQVWRHAIGASDDDLVYQEDDDRFRVGIRRSRSDQWLFLSSHSSITSEVRVCPADEPDSDFRVLAPRHTGCEYSVAHQGDRFLVLTNDADDDEGNHTRDAENFKVMTAPLNGSSRDDWTTWISHDDDVFLVDVDAFAHHVVISERQDGLGHLRVIALDSGEQHRIELPEPVYTIGGATNAVYDTDVFRFSYTSLVTPSSTFDYDMSERELVLRKQEPVLGDFDRDDYVSERLWATAPDGTRIPMSLVRRKDVPTDAPQPTMLYGYGSYGLNIDPSFRSTRLSLLDRGVVFAIAHIRGSSTMGRAWYEDGKFLHKKNTFFDFIACAEHLVESGVTTPELLAIRGGSAGGLLMGAVLNERPELFHAAVAQVPFVDIVSTMLDESIPLTTNEWEEWGDPREREFFDYMLSYSPYDNVKAQDYPHLLVVSGLNDPRVQYWEPTKWVARLRERNTGDGDLLLHTHMGAGHGGKSGRYGRLEDLARIYAFLLDKWGLADREE